MVLSSSRVALWAATALVTGTLVLSSTRVEVAGAPGAAGIGTYALYRISPAADAIRCALVSSSGELLAERLGPEIEAHDVVVRFNAAPTAGFAHCVGNRTDARLVASPEASELVLSERLVSPIVFLRHRSMESVDAFAAGDTVPIIVPECPQVAEKLANSDPSTGLLGILFFAHACSSVDLYGFNVRDLDAPYHYYGNLTLTQRVHFKSREVIEGAHKYMLERTIIEDYTTQGSGNVRHVRVDALRRLCSFPRPAVDNAAARLVDVARARVGAPSRLWRDVFVWPWPLG